jgi:hypothetical protein
LGGSEVLLEASLNRLLEATLRVSSRSAELEGHKSSRNHRALVSKGKASWYLKLERYSSSTVFIKNAEALTSNFPAAQKKIEELKASNGK